jgi:hypothetical protein
MLAADVSDWLRPGAATSPDRLSCHVYGRGKGQAQMIPGWPYSVIAALEPGRTSWTAVLDAVRLGPDDDEAEVTAAQVRDVVARLVCAGHWQEGHPAILVIFDAGYDPCAWHTGSLTCLWRYWAGCARTACCTSPSRSGCRGRRAGLPGTAGSSPSQTRRPGRSRTHHHDGDYPVRHRGGAGLGPAAPSPQPPLRLAGPRGPLPVIEGTLIRLQVDHLPGDRNPKPVWLWCSRTGLVPAEANRLWQAFLRRFDLEHTFRLYGQVLGWTAPKIRDPLAADRWTWLIITCHAQLRLARSPARRRPAPALGTARRGGAAHPGPGPPGV